uniref:NADH-ubiquinone oxidoreductase chain 4 n=1 Tax=Margaritifera margaritifera TaxID=2505931 RepID=A0A455ZAQ3_9BIVA|nr:NADH dehydrogenase subunit 4 [Margaritifera margaritifera]QCX42036.1 NADH dehydrogenase subunit 4 [Margaritifera margaritifera]QRW36428.1 NADH dehydrogenase subunit 4 [Margaritifera margaritifera]DAC74122.1 TPA_inf: NADH dehydrogenase subunit 4 [Margaritifera margaritifera]
MFSLLAMAGLVAMMSGFELSVFWWVFTWGCVIMLFVSLPLWFSSLGLANCYSSFFVADNFSFTLVSLTILVCCFSVLASVRDVGKAGNSGKAFILSVLVLTVVLFCCFSVSSLFNFYILFEFSLIPTLFLIMGWGYQPERLQAGKYMMLYTVGASLPLLILVVFVLAEMGSIFYGWKDSDQFMGSWLVVLCASLAFLVKLPIYGFHLWLPKAHVEAPVAGSMILAGILLKLGGYGLIRFFSILSLSSCFTVSVVFCLSLMGGTIASMVCFAQVDVKALVAYSSVGHMSLVLGGIYSNTEWGWTGALLMMLAHGLCSSGMFFLASETYKCYHTRSLYLVKGGLAVIPGMSMCWFLMCAINMAAPPSLNLWSELMLGISILSYSMGFAIFTGFMTFLAAVYSWYVYSATQHGQSPLWARGGVMMEEYINYVLCFGLFLPLNVAWVALLSLM